MGGLLVRMTGGSDGLGGGRGPLLVLMHGFGAPGTDLLPFAGEIEAPPGTRFAFPEAPLALPPEYGSGRAWWHIDIMELQMALLTGRVRELRDRVPEGLTEANAKVTAMLRELEPGERVLIGGFSQGAMLACDVVLRSTDPFVGLVMMSGTYLAASEWTPLMAQRKGLPVFMSHGREDPLLPFALAESLRDAMKAAGLEVEWVPFSGGHGVAPEVIDRLNGFVNQSYSSSP